MLRLVLLVLYLIAASSAVPQITGGDPSGLHQPPPTTDSGAGNDPNG